MSYVMAVADNTSVSSFIGSYDVISVVGQCFNGIGSVYLAKNRRDDDLVAIKKVKASSLDLNIAALIERDMYIVKHLRHVNIISYISCFVADEHIYLVSPLMAYGSCRDLLNNHFLNGLPEPVIVNVIRDVLQALLYIHHDGYIHRSIKSSHILLSDRGVAKLSGFRHACSLMSEGKRRKTLFSFPLTQSSHLNWLSPEVLEQNLQGYNEKSDIYCVGITLCELANGTEPYAGVSTTLMLTEKLRGFTPLLLDCKTVSKVDNTQTVDTKVKDVYLKRRFSRTLHELAYLCLQRDDTMRPSAKQLLNFCIKSYKANVKRAESLTDLLKPVIPLNDQFVFRSDDCTLSVVPENDITLPEFEWMFDVEPT